MTKENQILNALSVDYYNGCCVELSICYLFII